MRIVINPKYSDLNSFISCVPSRFEEQGEMIYDARNQLKKYSVEGYNVVVKRFRTPHIINRIAYSFFRPSKAKRSYEYALKLLSLGVDSPAPIAYIEDYKCGLLAYTYFISVYENDYKVIRELMDGTQKDELLLKELALYIAEIHKKGVLHLDMSPGNILYKKTENQTLFSLIDINRMQFFQTISTEKRYKSFKRLSRNEEVLTKIAKIYSAASNLDETQSIKEINKYNFEFFNSRKIKFRK